MKNEHTYRVVAWWSAGKTGLAKSDAAPNAIHFTAPPQFGGLHGRWSPEDLLLCAVAGCFTTTFRALSEYSKFDYADLEVEARGTIQKLDSGYGFSEMVLRPKLTMYEEREQPRARRMLEKAKGLCLVSRALSLPLKFEPYVELHDRKPSLV